ncbi:Integral membrane protein [Frankia sp. AiPs1]
MLSLAIGLGVGLARGGTLSALARVHVQRPWLFAALVLVLAVGGLVPDLHGPAWIVAAVLAALFAGMNNRLPGLGLLVAGIIANAAVITANGGQMPVSLWQAQHAGVPIKDIMTSAFHTPADGGTRLRLLSDIIPFAFPGVPAVLSVGDVVIAAALAVFGAVTPVRAWRTLQARRNAALAGALPAVYGGTDRPTDDDESVTVLAGPGTGTTWDDPDGDRTSPDGSTDHRGGPGAFDYPGSPHDHGSSHEHGSSAYDESPENLDDDGYGGVSDQERRGAGPDFGGATAGLAQASGDDDEYDPYDVTGFEASRHDSGASRNDDPWDDNLDPPGHTPSDRSSTGRSEPDSRPPRQTSVSREPTPSSEARSPYSSSS